MDLSRYDWLARILESIEGKLSQFADLIIVNSWAGRDCAISRGYTAHNMIVIPNGIDVAEFYPDKAAGDELRACWGLAPRDILIGRIGRLEPMKDYPTFFEAAAELKKRFPDVRFLCMGTGPPNSEQDLKALAVRLDLTRNLIFSGLRREMRGVYNTLSLLTSSSGWGEGFPNVVAEALACGVPSVVTDVGDSRLLVGHPDFVVPPRDPLALANAWEQCLRHQPQWNAQEARQRIVTNYNLQNLTRRTEAALLTTATANQTRNSASGVPASSTMTKPCQPTAFGKRL
jgi:glycosyltransferase involved in cell wall biosynthesis